MRRTQFSEHEHRSVMFRDCRRPCLGGRMFWTKAEPQWQRELGYVGLCSHCGWQVFSAELLGYGAATLAGGIGWPRGIASHRIGGSRTAA